MNSKAAQQLTGLFLLAVIGSTHALQCYTCSYVATSNANRACVDDPDAVDGSPFTFCSKKYCRIQRIELMSPRGRVSSFLRGCEDEPMNGVFEDPTFKTYYYSCNEDLCNIGNGLLSSEELSADGGPVSNLLVPGVTGRATRHAGHSTALVAYASCLAALATSVHRVMFRT